MIQLYEAVVNKHQVATNTQTIHRHILHTNYMSQIVIN